ncbi:MAG: hypothetical protein K6C99_05790 [Lachnospiraceae bacterium]|nr:hypothetical protein [Lachnospiraceae bacterium]
MQTILKTFRILLILENTINVNVILNGLRHIPIIGKYIPEKIYSIRFFKIYAAVLSVIYEIIKALFAKVSLFALVFFGTMVSENYIPGSSGAAYIIIFLAVSLCAAVTFNPFKITTAGEYAVFHMGMDAAKYVQSNIFYQIAKTFIGYTLFGIPTALLAGVHWPLAILIPFAGMGFISTAFGVGMSFYELKMHFIKKAGKTEGKRLSAVRVELRILFNSFALFILLIIAFAVTPFLIYHDLYYPGVIAVIVAAILFVPGILLIKRFPYTLYRNALSEEHEKDEIVKEINRKSCHANSKVSVDRDVNKKISIHEDRADSLQNNISGYKYLNELFLKRHSRAMFSRSTWIILMTFAGITSACLFMRMELAYTDDPGEMIMHLFFISDPAFYMLILLFTNLGMFMSEIMYKNCDSVLLKYSFYRKPEAMMKMYRLRVLSVIKYNLPLTIIIAIFSIVVAILTGGEDYHFQSVLNILIIFAAMAFYSVRFMTLHYLMQPFEENVKNIKAAFYYLSGFIWFVFWVILLIFKVPAFILAPFIILLTAGYFILSDKMIGKFAPKIFK